MDIFVYKAKDKEGKIVSGRIEAASFILAFRELASRKLEPISLRIKPGFFESILPVKVKARDRALFYRQLSTMLKAGVSIVRALEVCQKTENKYLSKIVSQIKRALEEGLPFSFTLAGYPKSFPEVDIGVIKAGEVTANLEKVLKELSDETMHSASFVSRIKGAMIYPAFILITLLAIGILVLIKVIPPIKQVFEEAKVPLPLATRILIKSSDFVQKDWLLIVIALVFLAILFRIFLSLRFTKLLYSKIMIRSPILGKFTQEVFLARFSRTLNLLLKAGIPIVQAIRITKGVTTNLIYQMALEKAAEAVAQGFSLSDTLEKSKCFPSMVLHLILTGEQTGDLNPAFNTMVEYYEEEVETKLKNFSTLIEPIIIVIIGIAVGFMILSILTPIYNIAQVT